MQPVNAREAGSAEGRAAFAPGRDWDLLDQTEASVAQVRPLFRRSTIAPRWRALGGGRLRTILLLAVAVGGLMHPSDAFAEGGPFAAPPTLSPQPPSEADWPSPSPATAEPSADDARYAKLCDAFGEGFVHSPETGACIHIGGYVKFGAQFGGRN